MSQTNEQNCATVARLSIATTNELAHGQSKKFMLACGDFTYEALLVNFEGKLFAYVNRCPHAGISLDWRDNKFFSVDKRYIMCANHGAVFEPPTGECIWGPCAGLALQSVPIEIDGEQVYASCPQEESVE